MAIFLSKKQFLPSLILPPVKNINNEGSKFPSWPDSFSFSIKFKKCSLINKDLSKSNEVKNWTNVYIFPNFFK